MSSHSTSPARTRVWSSRRAVSALGLIALVGGLLFTVSAPAGAAYPGDNGRIAFASDTRGIGGDWDIFTINPDGSGLQQVTANFDDDINPSWSPDGSRLAFASDRDGDFDIYTVAANGTDLDQAINETGDQTNPVWSLDGDTIAVETPSSLLLAFGSIGTLPSLGGGPLPELTDGGGLGSFEADVDPAYSPDGDTLAFAREDVLGPASDIYLYDLNTDTEALVPGGFGFADSAPDFSPDGAQMVMERAVFFNEITVQDIDGTGAYDLPFSLFGQNPAYSPDGELVVFDLLGDLTIRLSDGSTSSLGFVTSDSENDVDPAWQPADFPAPVTPAPLPGFHRMSVVRTGTGTGTVTSTPAGVSCGSDCVEDYAAGTVVTLTAAPASGSTLASWNVAGCTGTTCAVTMNGDTTVNPVFNAVSTAAAAAPPLDARCGQPLVICGTLGHDILVGTSAGELILPFAGDDNTSGGGGNDVVVDPSGNNIIRGGGGSDSLSGGPGRDHIRGGAGNDGLAGGAGNDRLTGGAGNDACSGGPGSDLVKGCES